MDFDVDAFLRNEVTLEAIKKRPAEIVMSDNMTCSKCGVMKGKDSYYKSKSEFFLPAGRAPICKNCVKIYLGNCENLEKANKLCQYLDLAFDPNKWLELLDRKQGETFEFYYEFYQSAQNRDVDWSIVNAVWKKRAEDLKVLENIELNRVNRYAELRMIWGEYSDDELERLERYYKEIEQTQNVNTAIQKDNARKISKLSLKLDEMIKQNDTGTNIKNIVGAIDNLAKSADFTTKSAKNIGDFDSVGELFAWLEKRGWLNSFYDWKSKDEVDKVMKNIQGYCRRIIVGETNLSGDLEKKLDAFNAAQESEEDMSDMEVNGYTEVDIDAELQSEFDQEFDLGTGN